MLFCLEVIFLLAYAHDFCVFSFHCVPYGAFIECLVI